MFDEITRGLVKRIDYVTKFSTVVTDMVKRSTDLLCENGFSIDTDYIKDTDIFDDRFFISYYNDNEDFNYLISIYASINSEHDQIDKGFIGKIQLELREINLDENDDDFTDHDVKVYTMITISPGSPVHIPHGFGPMEKSNIHDQLLCHYGHRAIQGEISVGNWDHQIPCIENEIDPDNEEDFKLKGDWDREMIHEWFHQMMLSLDDIYSTSFKDEEYYTDQMESYK